MERKSRYPIDIVIMWVDGADPAWREKRDFYASMPAFRGADHGDRRYRDYGLLKYVFRGIEQNMPWVHKVFFVTNGQKPAWLNLDCKKLTWVKHSDFIPAEYLPTFSANPIELNLHRIEGLSERFIFFNDDMYVLKPVPESLYFRDGAPVANMQHSLTVPRTYESFAHLTLNNIMVINKNFNMRDVVFGQPAKWFAPWNAGLKGALRNLTLLPAKHFHGMSNPHMPSAFLKSTLQEVWDKEYEVLHGASLNKFRSYEDVTQYLFYEWQIEKGVAKSERRSKMGQYYGCTLNNYGSIASEIRRRGHPVICVNDYIDTATDAELDAVSATLGVAFDSLFPRKSSFEL